MALQIRCTTFDPGDAARITELTTLLGNTTPLGAVKKVPYSLKSASAAYVYEVACIGLQIHLEVSKDADSAGITTLENLIISYVGATGLLDHSNGWEMGIEDDLRVR